MEDGLYTRIQTLIIEGNIADAEQILDGVEEKDARWHYLSSHIYLAKNWTNEARKQLEIAIKLDPDNQTYKDELEELKKRAKETFDKAEKKQKKKHLGKDFFNSEVCNDSAWSECCFMCCGEVCCQAVCEGLSGGC